MTMIMLSLTSRGHSVTSVSPIVSLMNSHQESSNNREHKITPVSVIGSLKKSYEKYITDLFDNVIVSGPIQNIILSKITDEHWEVFSGSFIWYHSNPSKILVIFSFFPANLRLLLHGISCASGERLAALAFRLRRTLASCSRFALDFSRASGARIWVNCLESNLDSASRNLLRLRRKARCARLSPPADSRAFGARARASRSIFLAPPALVFGSIA